MFELLGSVAWDSLPQPPTNKTGEVAAALRALALVATPLEAERVYHRVLYAFGNNHAGTYYPVVLAAVPFLGELLRHGSTLARETTLDVLVDLTGSFEPEPGFESIVDDAGWASSLDHALRSAVAELGPAIRACASQDAPDRQRSLANELLSQLNDDGP